MENVLQHTFSFLLRRMHHSMNIGLPESSQNRTERNLDRLHMQQKGFGFLPAVYD